MPFAESFSKLLQHLLRNLLQRRQSVWKALLWGAVTVVVIGFVAGLVTVGYLLQDLPPITGLHEYQPSLVTRVYSADKQVIGQFFVERRILVPLDKIPRQLVNALVAIEDSRFFEHRGLDFVGIARAAITNLASGKKRQATVLRRMVEERFITPAEADAAMAGEVQFKRLTRDEPAPYFVEHIRQRLMATYGEAMVYKGGLQVYTTLSFPEQQTATTILEQGLRELDKRQGYRGPLRRSTSPGEFSAKRVNSGASADPASRPGGIIEAVVTRVEKDGLTVLARGLTGQIATDDLIWARRRLKGPDPIKHVKDTGAKTPDVLVNIRDGN